MTGKGSYATGREQAPCTLAEGHVGSAWCDGHNAGAEGREQTSRVSGHGLLHEGRPVLVADCCGTLDNHCQRNHYDKIGHGICSCAALSPCEDTTAARQRWHRKHKAEIASLKGTYGASDA